MSDEIRHSVFLPQTGFPMRANLPQKEPEILAEWNRIGLYRRLREKSKNLPKFVLHYGPPYANGGIHMGHALSECLKDVVVKSYQMSGYNAALIPGWDCHGLPIEWKIEEEFLKNKRRKEDISVVDFLSECRAFAEKWLKVQKEGLVRLGICADWDNPYKTMDPSSESAIVEQFLNIFMKGYVSQGQKPVMWSIAEKTALAEAEVEYHDLTSTAVYVAFPIKTSPVEELNTNAHVVIWTTTPWTLPANRAIAYHDEIEYALVEILNASSLSERSLDVGQKILVAKELLSHVCSAIGIENPTVVRILKGAELKGTICHHPFDRFQNQTEADKASPYAYNFTVPLISAKHVTVEMGTGLVHTAPSFGMDDFIVGKEYNLPMPDIVQADGTYVDSLPIFHGQSVLNVDDFVCDVLKQCNALLLSEKIVHSYPHSWRSKSPLIFRVTNQWFLEIDKIRKQALEAIERINWFPTQSKNRIKGMVESRPDWCLSRQRVWGVPLTLFVHKSTKKPLRDEAVNARIVAAIKAEGIEAWHKHDVRYFLQNDVADEYEKVMDTLDVWFDSACSHHFVLENNDDVKWPADLYLEGSDQHRGWFQSSLIESVATRGDAPYKAVVTHGFLLDKDGQKMSKSLGNVISCEDVIDNYGADLLRLWIVNMDYTEDVKIGEEILKRQEDIYRRFRNTLRYLLGSINDFNQKDAVKYDRLPELEQYILHKLLALNEKHKACMKSFVLSEFYSDLHVFCANELSAFYFDIRKDSLYCDDAEDLKRRAAQTVMDILFKHLVHWLAPVLSFTAEEAWNYYNAKSQGSIHEQTFPQAEAIWRQPDLDEKWQKIRAIRRVITNAIEQERLAKTITSSLQAKVVLFVSKDISALLKGVDMSEVAIISQLSIMVAQPQAGAVTLDDVDGVGAVVSSASGTKCPRCWKVCSSVFEYDLCARCHHVIEMHPELIQPHDGQKDTK
jgi:isoleucyl-tRNA synthetase